jgi:hypothetical protein
MNERQYRPSKGFIVALIAIAILVILLAWPSGHPGIAGSRVRSISNLRQIGLALLAHAEANGGRLPPTLQQLSPDVIDITALRKLGFRDPDSKRDYDWLYLPRQSIRSLPPEAILASSPTAVPHKNGTTERIVLHRDGSVTLMSDSDFQRVIENELKDTPK